MSKIHVLDSETVDKIAAGEVVERPSSVVKELVENAIDAGATSVTVEIKEGGIEFIRVTDNGSGMEADQVRTAFLRHATSKIETSEDLTRIHSLGFRGEALSSIAAVARVELITKTKDRLVGTRIVLEGGREISFDQIGAPDGTTFIMRNLFFNTPVRRKFLKQPTTEGSYITELMEHLALSRPDIAFKLVIGNNMKFYTSGNGDMREVIYRIYGRDVANELIPIQTDQDGIRIEGYLGKPLQVRANRNFEIYFLNGRFIKSNVIAKAIEEGYKEYLMQHKFPLCVLHISMNTDKVDVNVHPTKMDVRFTNASVFCSCLCDSVKVTLMNHEMIPNVTLTEEGGYKTSQRTESKTVDHERTPEPFEIRRNEAFRLMEEKKYEAKHGEMKEFLQNPVWARVKGENEKPKMTGKNRNEKENREDSSEGDSKNAVIDEVSQIHLFEDKILSEENRMKFRIIGQVFETYWLIEFENKLLMIDQHAAHEKINYEKMMKAYRENSVVSQGLMPPVIVSLTGQEEETLKTHLESFQKFGFEVEAFGGAEYALRGVPADLFGCSEKELFLEVLDQLAEGGNRGDLRAVEEKIASMSCKAAVKGNHLLSFEEAECLINSLLTLENPYHCPHGRPTIISMTKSEMEKKFKRIVT